MRLSKEVKVRNKSRIDKKKYFGVGKEIREYKKLIRDTLYDEELLERELRAEESLQDYFNILNERLLGIRERLRELIFNVMKKGSRRVQTTDGTLLKFEELKDTSAIDIIANKQFDYLKNITTAQHSLIRKVLVSGQEKGESIDVISTNIRKRVKKLTKARADTIARSEIVKAHNQAQINTMLELGGEKYIYWTAQDKKVSKICKKNQGPKSRPHVYDLRKAGREDPMPVISSHPNCRCTILIQE